jgi:HSP20 family protein
MIQSSQLVEDPEITAQPNEILIQGSTEKHAEKTDKGVIYSEFGTTSLYRRFPLAAAIEIDTVTGNVENGILTVVPPKKKEAGKKIAVAA